MKDLVEYIAKSLVDEPDSVEVTEVEDEASVIRLKVSKDDLGKVIGKKAEPQKQCVRFGGCSNRDEKRSTLEIVE